MAEDYGVSLKITADTSDLDKIQQKVDETQKKIEHPVAQPASGKVNVEQPEPVTVKVSQDPDPLKIKVELPDPSEIEAAIPKKDFHVDVQPQLNPSKLQAIPPVKVPVEVEPPPPVTVEAKADKIRVEVEDAEAKKRIEALTAEEGVKRIRVVTEGGELATRHGGKEIFELEVDAEMAKQTIASLKADARLKVTADTSDALQKFNALRLVSSVMTGNFAQASAELAKLSSRLKSIGPGAFTAMGAAVYSLISAFGAARELFATIFNWNQPEAQIKEMGNTMNALVTKSREFAEAMDLERKAAEGVQTALKNQLDATLNLTKAQNELNRQRELSTAKTDDDRNRINAKYDAANAGADTGNAQQQVELRRKSTLEEIARLEKEISASKENQSQYEDIARRAGGEAVRLVREDGGASVLKNLVSNTFGFNTAATKTRALLDKASEARGNAADEEDRRTELERQLEAKRNELKVIETEAKTAATTKAANDQKADNSVKKLDADADKKEKSARDDQADFDRQRSRTASDAEFADRLRAAQRRASAPGATEAQRTEAENTQVEMLRAREQQANDELAAAEKKLAEELAKDAKDRDERRVSRAREDIRAAESTATGARRQREDLEAEIENRRAASAQDYFGNLARQIDDARPKDRLTAMGLGSGSSSTPEARQQARDVHAMVPLLREILEATLANKPDNTAVYAP